VKDGALLRKLERSGSEVNVAFSPDGSLLASGCNISVKLWSVKDGALLRNLEYKRTPTLSSPGTSSICGAVAFSPDGSLLASSAADGVRLWKVK
jgi:WD40 repeat protein